MKASPKGQKSHLSAAGLLPNATLSEPWQQGRRLKLFFDGKNKPELDRIEFHANDQQDGKFGFLQRGHGDKNRSFRWTEMPQALSLFFLDYLNAGLQGRAHIFRRTPQTNTLADAVVKNNGKLYNLFEEYQSATVKVDRVDQVFEGNNPHGTYDRERTVFVKTDYLPADCIEVFWERRPLIQPDEVKRFTELFRKAWNLPAPSEPELPIGEASPPPKSPPPEPPKQPRQETTAKPPGTPPAKEPTTAFGMLEIQKEAEQAAHTSGQPRPESPPTEPNKIHFSKPPLASIDPRLFEIQHPAGATWKDQDGLLNFGDDDADIWRIRDASEGVLIFGAVGSGKTSGSGSAIATAFLQAGYGGLVLTAKPDEAKRWLKLCEQAGRAGDCVHVTPGSGHKLNILQYEAKRPGERLAVTDDLMALLRCLIGVMSRSKRHSVGDDFWSNSTNQLMRMSFEVFLLAGEPLNMDSLIRFIHLAPLDLKKPWQDIPYFSDLFARAGAFARNGTLDDQRIYTKVHEYWTNAFPKITDATRSGIVTGFTAMADVLGGRGIHDLIATETNLTPEMILSGKIVILDFPLKESVQGGLMVQAAWKLLFQQAIERRTDKGLNIARPCFLWEDEGHLFFSQHDVDFQPTARDCRAAHVILSQNIHNFLHQGHDPHAIYAVFSAMNTNIFHTNGDPETNRWASERIGRLRTNKLTTAGLVKPFRNEDYSIFSRRPEDTQSVGSFQWEKRDELAIAPEDFSKLKRGGDGTCEAVILWLSHQFAINKNRNFCVKVFEQEPR